MKALCLPLFVALPFTLSGTLAAQESGSPALRSSSELKDQIDLSLHWLRGQQDTQTGSYGSLLETLAALEVLATSHRKYVPSDGPFVAKAIEFVTGSQREDGAICDPDVDQATAERQTTMAIRVLKRCGGQDEAVEAAVEFVGVYATTPEDPFADQWLEVIASADDPRAVLLGKAAGLLASRNADGSWDSQHGPVIATCSQLAALNSLARTIAGLEPRGEPTPAKALPSFDPGTRQSVKTALDRSAAFLLEARVDGLWGFQGQPDPGITAMVTGALLAVPEPRPAEVQSAIDGALDWLVALQKPDGSIHAGQLANYVTSASVMALARAGREQDVPVIERAREYLVLLQSDEGEGYGPTDRFYGGVGYGGDERPDLSNMQMALEALAAAGTKPGDETFRKALLFLQRCQNNSETNDLALESESGVIVAGNDGGAAYAPGDSKAGYIELADGKKIPRSYGSMTYALLKGYLFAGLPKDDPRVEAAWKWLTKNYTLDVNPGFETSSDPAAAYQGLFYYFHTMAKALDLYDSDVIVDAAGVEHAWRSELAGRLVAMQRQDGSWVNENAARWFEGNPVLATAYAMATLDAALPPGD